MAEDGGRCVLLVDMDCFYVQVEQNLCPETAGRPAAVAQYTTWKGGGIIAVNYEARAAGVRRGMLGDEARRLCPELLLFRVPERGGKADLGRYRAAGARVLQVLQRFSDTVERASVDEAYVLLQPDAAQLGQVSAEQVPNTMVVGYLAGGDDDAADEEAAEDDEEAAEDDEEAAENDNDAVKRKETERRRGGMQRFVSEVQSEFSSSGDRLLAAGAAICERIRQAVFDETGYRCSAGVAHNKLLAKLAAGMNKPNGQTLLPRSSVAGLFNTLPVNKLRHLGGKLGAAVIEQLGCSTMGQLAAVSLQQLQTAFDEKTGMWLYQLARGVDQEPVSARLLPKSIGCGRNFRGAELLRTVTRVRQWLGQLAEEVSERLQADCEANDRRAQSLTVTVLTQRGQHLSRTTPLRQHTVDAIVSAAYRLLCKLNSSQLADVWDPPLANMGICAAKFVSCDSAASGSIAEMFARVPPARPLQSAATTESASVQDTAERCSSTDDIATAPESVPLPLAVELPDDDSREMHQPSVAGSSSGAQEPSGFFALRMRQFEEDSRSASSSRDSWDCGAGSAADPNTSAEFGGDNAAIHRSVEADQHRSIGRFLQPSSAGVDEVSAELEDDPVAPVPGALNSDERRDSGSLTDAVTRESARTELGSVDDIGVVSDETTPCPRCSLPVSPWTLPEHLDYHLALDLSQEDRWTSSAPSSSASPRRRPSSTARGLPRRKRGRPDQTACLKKRGVLRNIDQFFRT